MEVERVDIETLSRQSATLTIKCGWWAGRKILKLVKNINLYLLLEANLMKS